MEPRFLGRPARGLVIIPITSFSEGQVLKQYAIKRYGQCTEIGGQPPAPAALTVKSSSTGPQDRRRCGRQSLSGRGDQDRNTRPCLESNPVVDFIASCFII